MALLFASVMAVLVLVVFLISCVVFTRVVLSLCYAMVLMMLLSLMWALSLLLVLVLLVLVLVEVVVLLGWLCL